MASYPHSHSPSRTIPSSPERTRGLPTLLPSTMSASSPSTTRAAASLPLANTHTRREMGGSNRPRALPQLRKHDMSNSDWKAASGSSQKHARSHAAGSTITHGAAAADAAAAAPALPAAELLRHTYQGTTRILFANGHVETLTPGEKQRSSVAAGAASSQRGLDGTRSSKLAKRRSQQASHPQHAASVPPPDSRHFSQSNMDTMLPSLPHAEPTTSTTATNAPTRDGVPRAVQLPLLAMEPSWGAEPSALPPHPSSRRRSHADTSNDASSPLQRGHTSHASPLQPPRGGRLSGATTAATAAASESYTASSPSASPTSTAFSAEQTTSSSRSVQTRTTQPQRNAEQTPSSYTSSFFRNEDASEDEDDAAAARMRADRSSAEHDNTRADVFLTSVAVEAQEAAPPLPAQHHDIESPPRSSSPPPPPPSAALVRRLQHQIRVELAGELQVRAQLHAIRYERNVADSPSIFSLSFPFQNLSAVYESEATARVPEVLLPEAQFTAPTGWTLPELLEERLLPRETASVQHRLRELLAVRGLLDAPDTVACRFCAAFVWFVLLRCRKVHREQALVDGHRRLAKAFADAFPLSSKETVPPLDVLEQLLIELQTCLLYEQHIQQQQQEEGQTQLNPSDKQPELPLILPHSPTTTTAAASASASAAAVSFASFNSSSDSAGTAEMRIAARDGPHKAQLHHVVSDNAELFPLLTQPWSHLLRAAQAPPLEQRRFTPASPAATASGGALLQHMSLSKRGTQTGGVPQLSREEEVTILPSAKALQVLRVVQQELWLLHSGYVRLCLYEEQLYKQLAMLFGSLSLQVSHAVMAPSTMVHVQGSSSQGKEQTPRAANAAASHSPSHSTAATTMKKGAKATQQPQQHSRQSVDTTLCATLGSLVATSTTAPLAKDSILDSLLLLIAHATYYTCVFCFPNDVHAGVFDEEFRTDVMQWLSYCCHGVVTTHVQVKHWPQPSKKDHEAALQRRQTAVERELSALGLLRHGAQHNNNAESSAQLVQDGAVVTAEQSVSAASLLGSLQVEDLSLVLSNTNMKASANAAGAAAAVSASPKRLSDASSTASQHAHRVLKAMREGSMDLDDVAANSEYRLAHQFDRYSRAAAQHVTELERRLARLQRRHRLAATTQAPKSGPAGPAGAATAVSASHRRLLAREGGGGALGSRHGSCVSTLAGGGGAGGGAASAAAGGQSNAMKRGPSMRSIASFRHSNSGTHPRSKSSHGSSRTAASLLRDDNVVTLQLKDAPRVLLSLPKLGSSVMLLEDGPPLMASIADTVVFATDESPLDHHRRNRDEAEESNNSVNSWRSTANSSYKRRKRGGGAASLSAVATTAAPSTAASSSSHKPLSRSRQRPSPAPASPPPLPSSLTAASGTPAAANEAASSSSAQPQPQPQQPKQQRQPQQPPAARGEGRDAYRTNVHVMSGKSLVALAAELTGGGVSKNAVEGVSRTPSFFSLSSTDRRAGEDGPAGLPAARNGDRMDSMPSTATGPVTAAACSLLSSYPLATCPVAITEYWLTMALRVSMWWWTPSDSSSPMLLWTSPTSAAAAQEARGQRPDTSALRRLVHEPWRGVLGRVVTVIPISGAAQQLARLIDLVAKTFSRQQELLYREAEAQEQEWQRVQLQRQQQERELQREQQRRRAEVVAVMQRKELIEALQQQKQPQQQLALPQARETAAAGALVPISASPHSPLVVCVPGNEDTASTDATAAAAALAEGEEEAPYPLPCQLGTATLPLIAPFTVPATAGSSPASASLAALSMAAISAAKPIATYLRRRGVGETYQGCTSPFFQLYTATCLAQQKQQQQQREKPPPRVLQEAPPRQEQQQKRISLFSASEWPENERKQQSTTELSRSPSSLSHTSASDAARRLPFSSTVNSPKSSVAAATMHGTASLPWLGATSCDASHTNHNASDGDAAQEQQQEQHYATRSARRAKGHGRAAHHTADSFAITVIPREEAKVRPRCMGPLKDEALRRRAQLLLDMDMIDKRDGVSRQTFVIQQLRLANAMAHTKSDTMMQKYRARSRQALEQLQLETEAEVVTRRTMSE